MKIELSGRVFAGQGEGRKYVERQWVRREIEEKLGFTPYAGTLNLRLSAENVEKRRIIEESAIMRVCASEGCCGGLLFKALIGDLQCGVVIPEVEVYPRDVLEIIAWTNLRERLHLQDNDEVKVKVSV